MARHLQHVRSAVVENDLPKLPTPQQIMVGEIAINYAKDHETISLKNNNDEIVTFTNDKQIKKLINEKVADVKNGDTSIVNEDKVAILPTATTTDYGLVIVDEDFDSGSTNPIQNSAITKNLTEIRKVTSAALNDLEKRKANVTALDDLTSVVNGKIDDVKIDGTSIVESNVANIPIATTLAYGVTKVDDTLDSGSTNPIQNKVVSNAIVEIEEITSAALNDLENRKINDVTINGESITENNVATIPFATATTYGVVKVDDTIDSGSTNPIQNKVVNEAIDEIEEVTAAALNDINERLDATNERLDATQPRLKHYTESDNSASIKIGNGEVTIESIGSVPIVEIMNDNIVIGNDIANISIVTQDGNATIGILATEFNYNGNEVLTKGNVDEDFDSGSTNPIQNATIAKYLESKELVVSAALNDLNDAIKYLEGLVTSLTTRVEALENAQS